MGIIASPVSTVPSPEIHRDEVHRIGRSPASNRLYVHRAVARFFASRSRIGFFHALGATIAANPAIGRGARRKDPCGDHHHRHRPDARIWRHFRRISTPYPDRFWSFDSIRRIELLSLLLFLRRWGVRLLAMSTSSSEERRVGKEWSSA